MNILQGILGAVGAMSGGQQQQAAPNPMINVVLSMLANGSQSGGLGGLLQQFQGAGLGNLIQSWISTGQNLPINAGQMQQVLGNDQLSQIAQQLGMNQGDAAGHLSQALPQIIDMLTPHGQAPAGGLGDINSILGMLRKAVR